MASRATTSSSVRFLVAEAETASPILVGGTGKGAIARVVEYGSEWLPQGGMPAPVLATRIAALRTAAVERGRTGDLPVTVFEAPLQPHELEAARRG